jgi:hypothetical protein
MNTNLDKADVSEIQVKESVTKEARDVSECRTVSKCRKSERTTFQIRMPNLTNLTTALAIKT